MIFTGYDSRQKLLFACPIRAGEALVLVLRCCCRWRIATSSFEDTDVVVSDPNKGVKPPGGGCGCGETPNVGRMEDVVPCVTIAIINKTLTPTAPEPRLKIFRFSLHADAGRSSKKRRFSKL